MNTETKPGQIMIALDGPDVSVETADTALLLSLSGAFIAVMTWLISADGLTNRFHGLGVVDKCAAVTATLDPGVSAVKYAKTAIAFAAGGKTPRGVGGHVKWLRDALQSLPPGHSVTVYSEGAALPVLVDAEESPGFPWERDTFRARTVAISGNESGSLKVRFRSETEGDFSLSVKHIETAKALGGMLLDELEITAEFHRGADGTIDDGELQEYVVVEDGDAEEAWRTWFAPHAGYWNEQESIEGALGRDTESTEEWA